MYKILSILILMTTFSFANEYDELIQKQIDFRINDTYEEVTIGLNKSL